MASTSDLPSFAHLRLEPRQRASLNRCPRTFSSAVLELHPQATLSKAEPAPFINVGWTPLPIFDDSLVLLAMFASVEAIFLSTFVLISQNLMAALADKRADSDLQVAVCSPSTRYAAPRARDGDGEEDGH